MRVEKAELAEISDRVKALFERKGGKDGWTKGIYWLLDNPSILVDNGGVPNEESISCCCLVGAVRMVTTDKTYETRTAFYRRIEEALLNVTGQSAQRYGCVGVMSINDDNGTTYEHIIAALDEVSNDK